MSINSSLAATKNKCKLAYIMELMLGYMTFFSKSTGFLTPTLGSAGRFASKTTGAS